MILSNERREQDSKMKKVVDNYKIGDLLTSC